MHEREGASGSLPAALEFEGRFMSSRPVTDNLLWWHRDQNPEEQHSPDFIPLENDAVPSHFNSIGQPGWNTERLNIGHSGSISMENQSGYSDRLMENERISSAIASDRAGSGLNNSSVSNSSLIRPVVVQNLRSANLVSSVRQNFEHNSTASSSSMPQRELVSTSSLFKEGNSAGARRPSAAETFHTSEKRKVPEGSWDASSASAHKRSVQVSGSSALQATPHRHTPANNFSISSSSANVVGVGSSVSVQSGAVPLAINSLLESPPESGLAGRSQSVQQNFQIQNTQIRTDTSLQGSVPVPFDLSGIEHNSYPPIQRPRLILPPPQVAGQRSIFQNISSMVLPSSLEAVGSLNVENNSMSVTQTPHMVLPPRQAVGNSANFQNHTMPVNSPTIPQQSFQLTRHHSASSHAYAAGTIQVQELGSRNSIQSLQHPVIASPFGSRNLRQNLTNLVPSGGVAVALVNTSSGLPSDPMPSGPRPVPNLVSNGTRRRRMEQVRQALLAVNSMQGTLNPTPQEIPLQSGATSQGTQTMNQGATLTYVRNHSNSGVPGQNASTNSFDAPIRQMLLSQARHMFALHRERGGRDMQAIEDVANARQSLLASWASMHDQHRDMRLDVDNMSYEELLELGDRIGHVKTGLSEDNIMKCMKHYKYTVMMKSSNPNVEPCSICQEDYAEGEDLGALECGHEYHIDCIKQWLVQKNSCPICKIAASSSK